MKKSIIFGICLMMIFSLVSVFSVSADTDGRTVIEEFVEIPEHQSVYHINMNDKPALEELTGAFPKTISVEAGALKKK